VAPALAIPILALGALLSTMVLYGMLQGSQSWLTTLLNRLAHPQGNFITRAALYPVTKAAQGVISVLHSVEHTMSVAAVHGMGAVTRWFDGLARWLTHNAIVAGNFAEEVASGFERLTVHTIPRAVAKAIAVPIHEVRVGLRHTEAELAQLRRYARGIDTLVRDRLWPALRRVAHAVDVTLPRSLGRVRARVGAAERAIARPSNRWIKAVWRRGWILVGAGLMVKFLVRKFPYLFCRNSTNALKAVCGLETSLLDSLLLDATAIIGAVSVVEFAEALLEVEDEALGVFRGLIKELP
jgi:hypothetical protein